MRLPQDFALPSGKLPLTEGQVHFIRFVPADGTIRVANLNWLVPAAQVGQGVWATLLCRIKLLASQGRASVDLRC